MMLGQAPEPAQERRRRSGFTLIELMAVTGIIVMLVAILLPSFSAARRHARNAKCGSNLHNIGLALADYLFTSNGTYPPSYAYPLDGRGQWTPFAQAGLDQDGRPFGHVHWSWLLFDTGQIGEEAFQCPEHERGGAPRTNPGPDPDDWEPGQVDDSETATAATTSLEDKQAPRIAYAANAAIIPRNKFTTDLSHGDRVNMFVKETRISRIGDTILVTELINDWKAVSENVEDGLKSKSHRPISPFYHRQSGYEEYAAPDESHGFMYGPPDDQEHYGLKPLKDLHGRSDLLDGGEIGMINAVGRHHPTENWLWKETYGGSTNFLFGDAHVENMTVLESMHQRKWGDAYYSLSGKSDIVNMSRTPGN